MANYDENDIYSGVADGVFTPGQNRAPAKPGVTVPAGQAGNGVVAQSNEQPGNRQEDSASVAPTRGPARPRRGGLVHLSDLSDNPESRTGVGRRGPAGDVVLGLPGRVRRTESYHDLHAAAEVARRQRVAQSNEEFKEAARRRDAARKEEAARIMAARDRAAAESDRRVLSGDFRDLRRISDSGWDLLGLQDGSVVTDYATDADGAQILGKDGQPVVLRQRRFDGEKFDAGKNADNIARLNDWHANQWTTNYNGGVAFSRMDGGYKASLLPKNLFRDGKLDVSRIRSQRQMDALVHMMQMDQAATGADKLPSFEERRTAAYNDVLRKSGYTSEELSKLNQRQRDALYDQTMLLRAESAVFNLHSRQNEGLPTARAKSEAATRLREAGFTTDEVKRVLSGRRSSAPSLLTRRLQNASDRLTDVDPSEIQDLEPTPDLSAELEDPRLLEVSSRNASPDVLREAVDSANRDLGDSRKEPPELPVPEGTLRGPDSDYVDTDPESDYYESDAKAREAVNQARARFARTPDALARKFDRDPNVDMDRAEAMIDGDPTQYVGGDVDEQIINLWERTNLALKGDTTAAGMSVKDAQDIRDMLARGRLRPHLEMIRDMAKYQAGMQAADRMVAEDSAANADARFVNGVSTVDPNIKYRTGGVDLRTSLQKNYPHVVNELLAREAEAKGQLELARRYRGDSSGYDSSFLARLGGFLTGVDPVTGHANLSPFTGRPVGFANAALTGSTFALNPWVSIAAAGAEGTLASAVDQNFRDRSVDWGEAAKEGGIEAGAVSLAHLLGHATPRIKKWASGPAGTPRLKTLIEQANQRGAAGAVRGTGAGAGRVVSEAELAKSRAALEKEMDRAVAEMNAAEDGELLAREMSEGRRRAVLARERQEAKGAVLSQKVDQEIAENTDYLGTGMPKKEFDAIVADAERKELGEQMGAGREAIAADRARATQAETLAEKKRGLNKFMAEHDGKSPTQVLQEALGEKMGAGREAAAAVREQEETLKLMEEAKARRAVEAAAAKSDYLGTGMTEEQLSALGKKLKAADDKILAGQMASGKEAAAHARSIAEKRSKLEQFTAEHGGKGPTEVLQEGKDALAKAMSEGAETSRAASAIADKAAVEKAARVPEIRKKLTRHQRATGRPVTDPNAKTNSGRGSKGGSRKKATPNPNASTKPSRGSKGGARKKATPNPNANANSGRGSGGRKKATPKIDDGGVDRYYSEYVDVDGSRMVNGFNRGRPPKSK